MFPFIYRRQTVQAQPGPRRGHTQTGSRGRAVPPIEDGGVLIGRRVAGRPGGWADGQTGRQADGQMGLEARRWALLNLGFKGAIELSLLIVHLTQDHVVLQEEFVSHTKSGKSKQEREAMEGSQWMVGAPDRPQPSPGGRHVRTEVLESFVPSTFQKGSLKGLITNPVNHPGSAQSSSRPCSLGCRTDRWTRLGHSWVFPGGVGLVGSSRNLLPQSRRGRKREKDKETEKD